MNEASSDCNPKVTQQISCVPTSSQREIDELAGELADSYINYITVDTSEQERRFDDALEECLTHLEEVCSVLDSYRQTGSAIPGFVEKLATKNDELIGLYEQIDALEQYIFETNQLLGQLDSLMKNLESFKGSNTNRIRRIIHLIPRLSLGGMPRLLDSFNGSMEENHDIESSVVPVSEILSQVTAIEASFTRVNSCFLGRIHKKSDKKYLKTRKDQEQSEFDSVEGQVDSSWQELL